MRYVVLPIVLLCFLILPPLVIAISPITDIFYYELKDTYTSFKNGTLILNKESSLTLRNSSFVGNNITATYKNFTISVKAECYFTDNNGQTVILIPMFIENYSLPDGVNLGSIYLYKYDGVLNLPTNFIGKIELKTVCFVNNYKWKDSDSGNLSFIFDISYTSPDVYTISIQIPKQKTGLGWLSQYDSLNFKPTGFIDESDNDFYIKTMTVGTPRKTGNVTVFWNYETDIKPIILEILLIILIGGFAIDYSKVYKTGKKLFLTKRKKSTSLSEQHPSKS